MVEKLKKHKGVAFAIGIGFFSAVLGILIISGMIVLPDFAAADDLTVNVTATVQSQLYFAVSTTSVALTPALVNTAGGTNIGSSTNVSIDIGTNSAGGWQLQISGANGGLVSSTEAVSIINTVGTGGSASTTLVAGTSGYGANATPSIADVNIGAPYDNWGTVKVGAISSTTVQVLANKASANASATIAVLKIYAAASSTKPAGTYTDTITLTATSQ